jgi:predicted peptidase
MSFRSFARSLTTAATFPLLLLLSYGCHEGGRRFSETEFASRQVSVSGFTYGYRIYVPPNRWPGERLPVMLYLHGSNRRGSDNQSQVEDLAEAIKGFPEQFPYIIVLPQCREQAFWAGPMMEMAMAALDQTVKEFDGDPDRLYLAGYSMGGFGVWQTAITHPDKFAALVSVAGGIPSRDEAFAEDRALLSPQVTDALLAEDPYRAFGLALAKVPAWIVHGDQDRSVPVTESRNIVAALKAAGNTEVNYTELAGVGHGSLVPAFSDSILTDWLSRRRRR